MNAFAISGAAVAVLMYIPLSVKVWRKALVQNFATYLLWGLLDIIAAGSILMQGGNFLLPVMYALLTIGVLVGILRTRTFTWSWRKIATFLFVVASIIVWFFVSNKAATIVSTLSVVAACVPQLYDIWKEPRDAPVFEYIGFTVANGLSTMAGNDWSVQERFYGASCTIATLLFVYFGARKWLPRFRTQLA